MSNYENKIKEWNDERKEMVYMYNDKRMSIREIANHFKVSDATVWKRLNKEKDYLPRSIFKVKKGGKLEKLELDENTN